MSPQEIHLHPVLQPRKIDVALPGGAGLAFDHHLQGDIPPAVPPGDDDARQPLAIGEPDRAGGFHAGKNAGFGEKGQHSISPAAQARLAAIRAVESAVARRGLSVAAACKVSHVHRANFDRWSKRLRERGPEGLEDDYSECGRTALAIPTEAEVQFAREKVLVLNRADGAGSITAAAQALAEWEGCSEETRAAILKPRASRHTLTPTLRRAFAVEEQVIRYHRTPREVENSLANRRGCMRAGRDGARLRAGWRQSWDDGSINFLVCVPWQLADDVCSRKFGVKLGRFQLLIGIDDAVPYCPGFDFTMRPRQSYRSEDVIRAMARTWAATGKPAEVVLERGVWESKRVQEFLAAAGVAVTRAYRPNHKLIENYFNGLWTALGDLPGQIGRFRGEMEENSKIAEACKSGHKDPTKFFPRLDEVMNTLEHAITLRNRTRTESDIYGQSIPAEIWEEEAAARPRLVGDFSHHYQGEAKEWTVLRCDSVGGSVMSPFGESIKYYFQSEGLWRHQGEKVRVHFDPFAPAEGATIVALQNSRHARIGEVIARKADCISNAPSLVRDMKGWEMDFRPEAADLARRHRRTTVQAIRSETRAIEPKGIVARTSTARDGLGNFTEISRGGKATGGEGAEVSAPRRPAAAEHEGNAFAARVAADPRAADLEEWEKAHF